MDLTDAMQASRSGWDARLALRYERRDQRTVLAGREHCGPLRVQRDLYPEGAATCHTIIVHPPGGIAGGDALALSAGLLPGAAALLTTPGAGKWYRSAGAVARQALDFDIAAGAVLEWLPQESIVFNGAVADMTARVHMTGDAVYLGWDIVCFGRSASGERYASGNWQTRTELLRDGRRLWLEQGRIAGGDALFNSPVGLAGHSVSATFLAAAPHWDGADAKELIGACREVKAGEGLCGITRLPGLMIARWLGDSAEEARHYFTALWMLLRPALKRAPAAPPRIWAT